jgi:hypothetical protein
MTDYEKYIYLNTKDEDFILLGNEDAFKGKEEQLKAIINVLKEYYGRIRIQTIIRNYLVGYRVGLIEKKSINGMALVASFDYKTGELKVEDFEGVETLPYNEEYREIQTEALEKAHALTKSL